MNRKSRENLGNFEICCITKTSIENYVLKIKEMGKRNSQKSSGVNSRLHSVKLIYKQVSNLSGLD